LEKNTKLKKGVSRMAKKEKIGWIGLGKMGTPMAKNILKAGYPLIVYNRTQEKTREFADLGARVAGSPKSLASGVDVIISMVSDDTALEAISMGPQGAFEGAKQGAVFIEMSTVSAVASARVAEQAEKKDIKYLRAPVTGGVSHAEEATLGVLASGPRDVYDNCSGILDAISQTSFYLGRKEEGRIMKLVLNMQVGIISAMTGEALTFGEMGGVDWNQMIDIIGNSIVATPMIKFRAQFLKDRTFTAAFTAEQMAKDFDLILDTGKAMNAPMPITYAVRQLLGIMKAQGKGNHDFWEFLTLLEELGGVRT
jgi:3-hydroxyisobutyrate dehydrogenase-like beta-hydroxyacid dehydrogenase